MDAWAASPARFREDANAEDDLVRGGYRDRVVVELAQNAADAAARAGIQGRLALTLAGDLLTAANTGAPLDAQGVESLSTLRASAKRDQTGAVGRFGVGFAAVLAVSDEPRIASADGAVRWDAAAARRDVEQVAALRPELARRGGQLPVLRLPYPWDRPPPDDATTVVELPLRDAAARDLAARLLGDVDEALLLALPGLTEIVVVVDGARRVVTDAGTWHVVRRDGRLDPQLLADRPVEERDRPVWSVTWARPLAAGQPVPGTVHAPTPTDEPLGLPALLVASFPLDPTRRHVAPGPLTDALVAEAAGAYVDLVVEVEEQADRLALVPGPVPVGRLDGQLRAAIVQALSGAPLLRTVTGAPVAVRDAVSIVGAGDDLLHALAGVVEGLVADSVVLDRLGGRRLRLADAVDLLADLDREPSWWRQVYAALAEGPVDAEALGALPVPLVDGRLVRGPRGALLPGDDLPEAAALLGLRVVHPEAAHPLLLRLGAATATARAVLDRPETREAVAGSWEHADPAGIAEAVLALAEAAGLRPGELPWLAELALVDDAGEPAAADELLLPGSPLAMLADPAALAAVHPDLVERWGERVLAAVGVLADLTVAEVHDLVLDPAAVRDDSPLPGLADWVAATAARLGPTDLPPSVRAMRGIRELDVVGDDGWGALLVVVGRRPELRSALLEPVTVDLAAQGRARVPSYAAWFARTSGLLAGRPPDVWRTPAATGLAGLYDPLPARLPDIDPEMLRAVGVRTSLPAVLDDPGGAAELLDRMADPARTVPMTTMLAVYRALAGLDPDAVPPPTAVRVGSDAVVPAAEAVVVDAPHHLQLTWAPPPIVVPLSWAPALADVLDVARSSDRVPPPGAGGSERAVPDVVARVLPGAPTRWREHDDLTVDGHPVTWWVDDDGLVHAATVDGLARGLAWATGRWEARWLVAAVLEDPDRVDELLAETRLDGT